MNSIQLSVPVMLQNKDWSCWYTSLQMVVAYHRKYGVVNNLSDPSDDQELVKIYNSSEKIGNTLFDRDMIARKLGFTAGYLHLTAESICSLLHAGPLIYAGQSPGHLSGHWVVITGISESFLTVNNPSVGQERWSLNIFISRYHLQTHERPLIYNQNILNKTISENICLTGNIAATFALGIAGSIPGAGFSQPSSSVAAGMTFYKTYENL